MTDITIIVKSTGHWSNIIIASDTALVVTSSGTSDISPESAQQLVSFCAARPADYTVTNNDDNRSN